MFSVTPEPAISMSAANRRAGQPRAGQSSPEDFGTLVDGNAAASDRGRSDIPATESRRARDPSAPRTKAEADAPAAPDAPAAQATDAPAIQDEAPGTAPQGDAKGHVKISAETDAETATDTASDDTPPPAESAAADAISQPLAAVVVPVMTLAEPVATATVHPTAALPAATDAAFTAAAVPEQAAATEPAGKQPDATAQAAPSAKAKTASTSPTAKDADAAAPDEGQDTTTRAKPAASEAAAEPVKDTAKETAKTTAKAQPAGTHPAVAVADPLTPPDAAAQIAAAQLPQSPSATAAAAIPAPQLNAAPATTPLPLNGLAVDIALRAAGGNSRFEIRLDPAELGRIDVRLEVDKHGNVTSHLTVERPATLDMLRNDAPKLQQALEDAGLKTGDGGLQFSLRDHSSSGQDNERHSSSHSARLVISEDDTVPAQLAGRSYGRRLGASSGVDIRV